MQSNTSRTLTGKVGYARRRNKLGDVNIIGHTYVSGILHKSQKPFRWQLGLGEVELIEFGSFNPRNPNYVKGGKVLSVS